MGLWRTRQRYPQVHGSASSAAGGTRIYHIPGYLEGIVNVKPGTLDETGWLRPEGHFWTGKRQAWLPLPEDASGHETQPFWGGSRGFRACGPVAPGL